MNHALNDAKMHHGSVRFAWFNRDPGDLHRLHVICRRAQPFVSHTVCFRIHTPMSIALLCTPRMLLNRAAVTFAITESMERLCCGSFATEIAFRDRSRKLL